MIAVVAGANAKVLPADVEAVPLGPGDVVLAQKRNPAGNGLDRLRSCTCGRRALDPQHRAVYGG
jgi:hypothetical protein